jgi:hypothetical protein
MALFCLGIDEAMQSKMIFGNLRQWADEQFKKHDAKKADEVSRAASILLPKHVDEYNKLAKEINSKMSYKLYLLKPTLSCFICFASFWGGIAYFATLSIHNLPIYIVVVCVPITACLNVLIDKIRK